MGRTKILIALGISTILLTGCGSSGKSLTCSHDTTYEGIRRHHSYVFHFDKNGSELQSYTEDTSIDYGNDITEDKLELEYTDAKEYCDGYHKLPGISCNLNKKGNKITAEIKVQMSKLDTEGKEAIDADEIEGMSYAEVKDNFEDSDYVCYE